MTDGHARDDNRQMATARPLPAAGEIFLDARGGDRGKEEERESGGSEQETLGVAAH